MFCGEADFLLSRIVVRVKLLRVECGDCRSIFMFNKQTCVRIDIDVREKRV